MLSVIYPFLFIIYTSMGQNICEQTPYSQDIAAQQQN